MRHVVNEHRSARLDDANGFVNPLEAPLQVVLRIKLILILAGPVIFGKIERRVGKNGVNRLIPERSEQIHAVGVVHGAKTGAENRFDRG